MPSIESIRSFREVGVLLRYFPQCPPADFSHIFVSDKDMSNNYRRQLIDMGLNNNITDLL